MQNVKTVATGSQNSIRSQLVAAESESPIAC
jgi:hypothetical protein